MNGGGNFFVENVFGEIYKKTVMAEDKENFTSTSRSAANAQEAAVNEATSKVRMSTELEVLRESNRAFLSSCYFDKNLGSSHSSHFAGKIFGDL